MTARYLKSSPRPTLTVDGEGKGCLHALAKYEQVGKGHRVTTFAFAKPCIAPTSMHEQEKAAGAKVQHRDAYGRTWY
jgi:hypothetical protein